MTRSLIAVIVTAVLVLSSSHAWAEPTSSEVAVARRLFEEGRLHQEQKQWANASAKYRKALTIKDTPGLRYRLGYCEEQQGYLVEAHLEYQRAAEHLASGVVAHDVAELLPKTLAKLEQRMPALLLVLSEPVENETLEIDGQAVAANLIGQKIPLNPGSYQVQLSAPGRQHFTRTLTLAEGEQQRIEVSLLPLGSGEHDRGAKAPPSSFDTAKVAVLAGEALLVAAGVTSGIIYTRKKASAEARIKANHKDIQADPQTNEHSCNAPMESLQALCADLNTDLSDRDRAGQVASGAFAVAAVGAAAAVVTYLAWPSRVSSSQGPAVRTWLAPKTAGFSLHGRF